MTYRNYFFLIVTGLYIAVSFLHESDHIVDRIQFLIESQLSSVLGLGLAWFSPEFFQRLKGISKRNILIFFITVASIYGFNTFFPLLVPRHFNVTSNFLIWAIIDSFEIWIQVHMMDNYPYDDLTKLKNKTSEEFEAMMKKYTDVHPPQQVPGVS